MLDSKLTTIFCCDLVGFSTMMNKDENGTIARLNECMDSIILPLIEEHNGRKFSGAGDSVYAEFPSTVNAVNFTIVCQKALHARNKKNPTQPPMLFRFSAHLGEVVVNGTDLLGETVNIAARIEPLAELGGISISEDVYQQVYRKLSDIKFVDCGLKRLKGISQPIRVFSIPVEGSKPNPNAGISDIKSAPVATTTQLSLKTLLADKSLNERTIAQAIEYKRKHEFDQAIRIFAVRATRRDAMAVDELINLIEKQLVPTEYMIVVADSLEESVKTSLPEKQYKIGKLFKSGLLGNDNVTKCIRIWTLCEEYSEEAQYDLGCAILDDNNCTIGSKNKAVEYLVKSARKPYTPAAMRLGKYYTDRTTKDAMKAFEWYWVARAYKEPSAQQALEILTKTMTRTDVQNAKINAEALVDEISWSSKY